MKFPNPLIADEASIDARSSSFGAGRRDESQEPNADEKSRGDHVALRDTSFATEKRETIADEIPRVGGQAVIEGVMMVVPGAVSVVVRRPSGEFASMVRPFVSLSKRKTPLRFPLLRGATSLVEMLSLGLKALTFSANEALGEDVHKKGSKALTLTLLVAIAVAVAVFVYLPIWLVGLMRVGQNQTLFNLTAGGIRLAFFLLYLYGISLLPDVRRVFAYHGAEHKSVACFEAGEELTVKNAKKYSPRHPRCGTSFLLVVLTVALILFAITDTILFGKIGLPPKRIFRFGSHLVLLPFVAGISYELTKLAGRKKGSRFFRSLSAPGLALQRITTREPSDDQIQVGLEALKLALLEAGRSAHGREA